MKVLKETKATATVKMDLGGLSGKGKTYQAKVVKPQVPLNGISEETLEELRCRQPEPNVLNEVQFMHQQIYGRTYAVIAPHKDLVIEALRRTLSLEGGTTVTMQIGRSFLRPNDRDQYVKEYGRLFSASRLEAEEFELKHVSVSGEKMHFTLCRGEENFMFYVRHDRDIPFLLSINDITAEFYNYAKKPNKTAYNYGRTHKGFRS